MNKQAHESVDFENPWASLPRVAPYVLEQDRRLIDQHNKRAGPRKLFHLDLLPDPYIGDLASNVILLALNPGCGGEEVGTHKTPEFRARAFANLAQLEQCYPFYYLDPDCPGGGRRFWASKLRRLIENFGEAHVARNVVCLQFHPYHSVEFERNQRVLPSQRFVFCKLRNAIGAGRTVVVMRSWRLWSDAVPELCAYERVVHLRNPRNPAVSPANCGDGFRAVVEALECADGSGAARRVSI